MDFIIPETLPSTPSDFLAVPVTDSSILVTWARGDSLVHSYAINITFIRSVVHYILSQ